LAESQSKDSKDLKEEVIMARGRRKVSIDSLDVKIEQQKAVMEKAKLKYEAEKEALAELIKLRNELRKDELMAAVIKSERSYEEIMAFIKGSAESEDE
jgi:hypothetical protein